VIIDLNKVDASKLPLEVAVSAITMAELAAGPHATTDPDDAHADRTVSNGPRPPSTRFPSTAAQPEHMDGSFRPSLLPGARHVEPARWICSSQQRHWQQVCLFTYATARTSGDSTSSSMSLSCSTVVLMR
jgi:hypothetical protein